MIDLLPEQTAYAEFTLTETPDSLPTVAAYKVSAGGVFGTASGMSETIVNVSGLSYYASAIVPEDAAPGDRYSLLVTVTVGGTASVFWLALGQVGGGLTPEQAAWLEETHEKAMLIGAGGAVVQVVKPVGDGGKIMLYSGFDYTASTVPITLPGATLDDETAVTLNAVPDRYGDDGAALVLSGTVSSGEFVFEATRAQLAISMVGQYRYQVWTESGGEHGPLLVGTLVVLRGK